MLKLDFTDDEIDIFKSKIRFSERQKRIIEYRREERSIIEMSMLEYCSERTIKREIKKIKDKIKKVI